MPPPRPAEREDRPDMFTPQHGATLWILAAVAMIAGGIGVFVLSLLPVKFRKPLIAVVTFVAGLYYVLEFMLPESLSAVYLTPYRSTIAQLNQVLLATATGVGVYSLFSVHGRAIVRRRSGWGFSATLLLSFFAIMISGFWHAYWPNRYANAVYKLCFDGGLMNLQAAMFSIVSFYIVSAAYRAFRVRSVEATILLASAFLVMIGQVSLGQAITSGLPTTGLLASFRLETIADWILTRVNSPALLAVNLGLGVGLLSTAIRLWLSLERGSYFDRDV